MWLLVGIIMLQSHAILANINNENAYYLTEPDRSLEDMDKNADTNSEFATAKEIHLNHDVNEQQQLQQDKEYSLDYLRLNSDMKRSIVRKSEHLQAPAPLATLLYWPERQDQERRNPSFSPWGGKRDSQRYKTLMKIRRPVRVPFNSWGGKRNDERTSYNVDDMKKSSSLSWEGKKTPPFNSWGGKRASNEFLSNYEPSVRHHYDIDEKNQDSRQTQRLEKIDKDYETMSTFDNADLNDHTEKYTNNENEIKRGPVKMITGGEMTTSGSTMSGNFRRAFKPWGGKRTNEFTFGDDQARSASASLIFRNVGRLPWIE